MMGHDPHPFMARARSRASIAPLRILGHASKQIPYTWIQLDMAAGQDTARNPPLASTPFAKVPLLVDEGASSEIAAPACACSKSGAILLYLPTATAIEFSQPGPARRSGAMGAAVCNATLGHRPVRRSRARNRIHRLMAARQKNTRLEAEPPVSEPGPGWRVLPLQAHLAYLPSSSPARSSASLPTRAGQHRGHPWACSAYRARDGHAA